MAKRQGNVSAEQKQYLLEYMQKKPDLTSGKFTKSFTYAVANNMWSDLATTLNQLNGGKKDHKSWRKVSYQQINPELELDL